MVAKLLSFLLGWLPALLFSSAACGVVGVRVEQYTLYPGLTETQALQQYWPFYIYAIVSCVAGLGLTHLARRKNHVNRKR